MNEVLTYEALKADRDALAVENAEMREAIAFATAPDMWIEQHDGMLDYRYSEWYVDVLNAAIETPATSAALAAIEARGVEKYAELFNETVNMEREHNKEFYKGAIWFAKQLREAK